MNWYAIQTITRKEHVASENISSMGIKTYAPRTPALRFDGHRYHKTNESLFPGYIFAQCDPIESFYKIKRAHGVQRMIDFAGEYLSVDEDIILDILANTNDAGLVILRKKEREKVILADLIIGEDVQVIEGPFKGFIGRLDATMKGGERVAVLLSVMGGPRAVEFDRTHVVSTSLL